MFILYFDSDYHHYYHHTTYDVWTSYPKYRPGESHWLVPGTDPDDPSYYWWET